VLRLLIATRNQHKAREFRELLGDEFNVEDLSGYPRIPDVAETGTTFAENAALKAVTVSANVEGLVVADDSGLEVDLLEGAPGVYSARYSGENATDEANMRRVLRELDDKATGEKQRTARFRCVIALARNGRVIDFAEGAVEGAIVSAPRGMGGFGYDPIFQPNGYIETFGELSSEVKNQISHRAEAVKALRRILQA
jgi:XTP/dITP diphosphohydrolase